MYESVLSAPYMVQILTNCHQSYALGNRMIILCNDIIKNIIKSPNTLAFAGTNLGKTRFQTAFSPTLLSIKTPIALILGPFSGSQVSPTSVL